MVARGGVRHNAFFRQAVPLQHRELRAGATYKAVMKRWQALQKPHDDLPGPAPIAADSDAQMSRPGTFRSASSGGMARNS